ncbi:hypothetical protein ACI2KR_30205 [Pseudomonas luteola]
MVQRSRDVIVNILCGALSGMRPATEKERDQYRLNTHTNFELLVVSNGSAVEGSHIARPGLAGDFDFERTKLHARHWFDMKGRDLVKGQSLSEVFPGRRLTDPFVAKAVDVLRIHAPAYAERLMLHGSAFPSMAIDMASDYIDRACYDDQSLSLEAANYIQMFLVAMSASAELPMARDVIVSPDDYKALRSQLDSEWASYETSALQSLVDEIDYSATPLPG